MNDAQDAVGVIPSASFAPPGFFKRRKERNKV